jgi:hypothetical protein
MVTRGCGRVPVGCGEGQLILQRHRQILVCFKTTWAAFPGCPASRHRLGPRDVPLEAKGFRHLAVAIPIVSVGGLVTARPRQQGAQPQQPDVAYRQTPTRRAGDPWI